MMDKFEVFDTYLQNLHSLIDKNHFSNCNFVCTNLTSYSVMSDYMDGLLIAEVLESVFSQLKHIFDMYEVTDEDKQILASKLQDGIDRIKKTYRDDDKNSLYDGLKKIRSDATYFQFNAWTNFSRKPRRNTRRGDLV